ncbi:MAG: RNA 2',3'-cyclic phosphodiesterase [Gammaproteobacteria bacterium]|nr:RNA 2',3'-cyclic phosphodiesterase [Gammaproteobacteria bacterium]
MKRLFVALTIPDSISKKLAALQPESVNQVRLVKPVNIHLTLHFIGQADLDKTAKALEQVSAQQFTIELNEPGVFRSRNGSITFWVGVQENEKLLALYHEIAFALADVGYQKEERTFSPHITLARCKKGNSRPIIDKFLQQKDSDFSALQITDFGLYSSNLTNAAPVYKLERVYPLE